MYKSTMLHSLQLVVVRGPSDSNAEHETPDKAVRIPIKDRVANLIDNFICMLVSSGHDLAEGDHVLVLVASEY